MKVYNQEVFELLPTLAETFQTVQPFKHVVIDNLFDDDFLQCVADEFYPPDDTRWQQFTDPRREIKLASTGEAPLPPTVKQFVRELNAELFLTQVSALTGIPGLIPDPYLFGAGMHLIVRGGKLAIHADFSKHPIMKIDRRLNLLVYLNKEWDESYGSHLELWDRTMQTCVKRILPVFNRTVLFLTDDFSFHGHPEPLNCPAHRTRKSIAMYYYTNGRPASELRAPKEHNTLFQERPQERQADLEAVPSPPSPQESVAPTPPPQELTPASLVEVVKKWWRWRRETVRS